MQFRKYHNYASHSQFILTLVSLIFQLAVASHPTGINNGTQECTKCNLSFGDKGEYLQHQLSFHQKSRKRRRNSEPVEDGALMKDGKYVCQFCNKTFDERTRYVSHMGAHVRYQGLNTDENNFGTAPIAIEGPPMVKTLENEKDPHNDHVVRIEVLPSIEKITKERTIAIQVHPSAENSKNDKVFAIQTPPPIENPITDQINGIQAQPLIKDPKIDSTVVNQSSSLTKFPEDGKAPAILPPLIEERKNDKSVSESAPISIENPDNIQTFVAKVPPVENPEKDKKSEASEIQFLPSIDNPENDIKPEAAIIEASSSIENPENHTEPITMLLEKDGRVEMSEHKSFEGNKGDGLTDPKVEQAVCGPLGSISGASVALSGEVYQDENATDGNIPLMFDKSNSSRSCSPVTSEKDSEVENNMENEHDTNNLAMIHEAGSSKTREVEASEALNHVEVEPNSGIFDSTFANAGTCLLEASQQACPDIETFDLNNYDIDDDGSKPEDIISATHRMLFENDNGAMSDETSFMDCDSVGEPKEVELTERPFTFSELLANANAHANAPLAETNQTCQESESLDLNNNTSDRIDNDEIEYEVDKLANSNTTPSQTILTNTPTVDYNSDLFASCFSDNVNEPNGSGFDINSRDSLLEEWEKPDTGLETRFQNNPSGCEDIVSGGTGHNFMEMMTMQENLEGYTSLVQSASTIPVANMMQDKVTDKLSF